MHAASRPLALSAIALVLAVVAPAAAGEQPGSFPGLRLADRVESQLARESAQLKPSLGHYGLVFPVEQADLIAFMRPVRVFGEPGAFVLGTEYGFESHGGGVLALLLDHWRPDDRPAELRDRFPFEPDRAGPPLAALYASHHAQVFLPVPGRATDEIRGAIPDSPQLARMLFRLPGGSAVEADAFKLLGLLAAREPDLARPWTNDVGQRLSAGLLLEHARRAYLASRDTPAEPEDHSSLHLVEILLDASRRLDRDPEEIQQHFLAVELARRQFESHDATLLLGHYAESLGRLVADPRVRWSSAERAQALAWLRWIEDVPLRSLAGEEPRRLAHLLLGLRLVRENRSRLEP